VPENADPSLRKSMFQKIFEQYPEKCKTDFKVQYKMHPFISCLSSFLFYDDQVQLKKVFIARKNQGLL